MKIIVIGLVVIMATAIFALECRKFVCEKDVIQKGEVCALQTLDLVTLKKCDKGLVCPTPQNLEDDTACMDANDIKSVYPGEYCTNSTQCIYGTCDETTNKCVGLAEGAECKGDEQCNAGLYCKLDSEKKLSFCVNLMLANQACSATDKCTPGTFCHKGNCTLYAQLDNGADAAVPALCKSYYTKAGKCTDGPKLQSTKQCPEDGTCKYKNAAAEEFSEPCWCGRTSEGTGYCRPGKGDVLMEDVFFE